MDITYEEDGPGHARIYNAKLRLPIEGSFGTEIFATGTGGKKKDAEKEVIIDACQKLQQRGLLRTNDPVATAAAVEARKRRLKELYGDDDQDQDEFYDRASSQCIYSFYFKVKKAERDYQLLRSSRQESKAPCCPDL